VKEVSPPCRLTLRQVRPRIVVENPDMVQPDIMKYIGHLWHDLQPNERVYYQDKAAIDKKRYQNQMNAFHNEINRLSRGKVTRDSDTVSESSKQFNKSSGQVVATN
jgi:hypothetical protein